VRKQLNRYSLVVIRMTNFILALAAFIDPQDDGPALCGDLQSKIAI